MTHWSYEKSIVAVQWIEGRHALRSVSSRYRSQRSKLARVAHIAVTAAYSDKLYYVLVLAGTFTNAASIKANFVDILRYLL